MRFRHLIQAGSFSLLFTVFPVAAQPGDSYSISGHGTRVLEGRGGLTIKVLVEAANLGGAEVEVAEITFPANSPGGEHVHQTNEIFYVLEGTLEHIVNGESTLLEPGMIGIVRKGDTVSHKIPSDVPCKALVIWAPGGEVERLAQFFESKPIE